MLKVTLCRTVIQRNYQESHNHLWQWHCSQVDVILRRSAHEVANVGAALNNVESLMIQRKINQTLMVKCVDDRHHFRSIHALSNIPRSASHVVFELRQGCDHDFVTFAHLYSVPVILLKQTLR